MSPPPLRLFLDTGVLVAACCTPNSAAQGILILTLQTPGYVAVRSEAIEDEVARIIARRVHPVAPDAASMMRQVLQTWSRHPQAKWYASPSEADIAMYLPTVLPVLRHRYDLRAVITAMQARPDWVISSNVEHWNQDLAAATGLRIETPWGFLGRLRP